MHQPQASVCTPACRPRVCIFIAIFYVQSPCNFADVSFSTNLQSDTRACVAGFHVWLLLRIRRHRFPRPIHAINVLTFSLSELHAYLCETLTRLVAWLFVSIILTRMTQIWEYYVRQARTGGTASASII